MSRIAILHPQCVRPGGAIQMALQACHVLQQQWHEVTLSTFEKSDECFPELQADLDIFVWNGRIKKEKIKNKKGGFFIINKSVSFLFSFLFFLSPKAFNIITLAFHLRHFDIIIANNPPMQIVAALAKVFSRNKVQTIWWHHHVPWYFQPLVENTKEKLKNKKEERRNFFKKTISFLFSLNEKFLWTKSFFERYCIIPHIDQMIATSHFVAEKIREYCGREAVVVHPVIARRYDKAIHDSISESMSQTDTWIPAVADAPSEWQTRVITSHEAIQETHTDTITLFTHGRLEAGKGIDTLVRVFQALRQNNKNIQLMLFWTGSMEQSLREQGIVVQPFQGNDTFQTLSSWQFWHVVGVYCSSIDAFGMASLESQMAGFPTMIMDRGGAREAILSDDDHQLVGHLVHSEEELLWTISRYVQNKILEKQMSNVNFSHKRDYFSPQRLSRDLLSIITKIGS